MDRLESLERQVGVLRCKLSEVEDLLRECKQKVINSWINYYPEKKSTCVYHSQNMAAEYRDETLDCICYHLKDGKLQGVQMFKRKD